MTSLALAFPYQQLERTSLRSWFNVTSGLSGVLFYIVSYSLYLKSDVRFSFQVFFALLPLGYLFGYLTTLFVLGIKTWGLKDDPNSLDYLLMGLTFSRFSFCVLSLAAGLLAFLHLRSGVYVLGLAFVVQKFIEIIAPVAMRQTTLLVSLGTSVLVSTVGLIILFLGI